MMRTLALLLMASAATAAPVPRERIDANPLGRGYMGIRPTGEGSTTVSTVEPNTPAARAGLKPQDKFLKVGPVEPRTFDDVREFVVGLRPGTRVKLVMQRGETKYETTIELAARPDDVLLEIVEP